jgi:hypothetical protein
MEISDVFDSGHLDDVYGLDVVHSVACLQSSVEATLHNPFSTQQDLERVKDLAEEVVDIASRLQGHFAPFSVEFEVINSLKDKVFDMVIVPLGGLLNPGCTENNPKELWQSIEKAFFGPWSLSREVRALEQFLN